MRKKMLKSCSCIDFSALKEGLGEFLSREEKRKFVFIRHGQSVNNKTKILSGQSQYPLSELGRCQALSLQASLCVYLPNFCSIWSSDLKRCIETTELATGLTFESTSSLPSLHIDNTIREINYGDEEGIDISEPEIRKYAFTRATQRDFHASGGESWFDVRERIFSFLEKKCFENGNYLIFTHGGIINSCLYDIDFTVLHNNCAVLGCVVKEHRDVDILFQWDYPRLSPAQEQTLIQQINS